jgi:hypothetical protein
MPKIIFLNQKRNYSDTQNSQGSKQTREKFFAKYDNINCRYGRLFFAKVTNAFSFSSFLAIYPCFRPLIKKQLNNR